jgi:hypothetical protein
VGQLLLVADEIEIDIHMPAEEPSPCHGKRPIDIIVNNRGMIGVKPAILKLLLDGRCDVDSVQPSTGKPLIIAAAGTANLECVKMLVEARADVHTMFDGANLAYYNIDSKAGPTCLFIRTPALSQ